MTFDDAEMNSQAVWFQTPCLVRCNVFNAGTDFAIFWQCQCISWACMFSHINDCELCFTFTKTLISWSMNHAASLRWIFRQNVSDILMNACDWTWISTCTMLLIKVYFQYTVIHQSILLPKWGSVAHMQNCHSCVIALFILKHYLPLFYSYKLIWF